MVKSIIACWNLIVFVINTSPILTLRVHRVLPNRYSSKMARILRNQEQSSLLSELGSAFINFWQLRVDGWRKVWYIGDYDPAADFWLIWKFGKPLFRTFVDPLAARKARRLTRCWTAFWFSATQNFGRFYIKKELKRK